MIASATPTADHQVPRAVPARNLYVHVPFCRAKCDYCDFYSVPLVSVAASGREAQPAGLSMFEQITGCGRTGVLERSGAGSLLERFVTAVVTEVIRESQHVDLRRLETVYLGGGTPSLLGEERLERLLRPLQPQLTSQAEVTVETNPEDVTEDYAAWAARRGLRISLGVQSFAAPVRETLGRRSAGDPTEAFRRLRAAGCANVGIDLMYGIPGQTLNDVIADLREVGRLKPDHVSWYELEVAAGTPLAVRLGADGAGCEAAAAGSPAESAVLDESDRGADAYRMIVRGMGRLGYRWYEVSNFARPGRRCRHNVACWRGKSYLGVGPAAVSGFIDRRRRNLPDVHRYLDALVPTSSGEEAAQRDPSREMERLGTRERAWERLLLAARIGAPVTLEELGEELDLRSAELLADAGFVVLRGGTLKVTRKGRYVANEVCVRLFRGFRAKGTV